MRIISLLTLLCSMLFIAGDAHAQRWDRTGWVKLGERAVNGRVDRDTITVGRYEGRYSKLTIAVERDDMELLDFEVVFAGGRRWTPPGVRHYFRQNSRTRVIDLPGDDRIIQRINLKYRNVGRRGNARIEVWGFKTTGDRGGRGDRVRPTSTWRFNSAGWSLLGERVVNGGRRGDSDRISVGAYKGRYGKLAIVVTDSDIELTSMEVKFARGREWRPAMAHYFREGQRSRVIDLPGRDERVIRWIDFRYRNLPGGGNARVQVWAR